MYKPKLLNVVESLSWGRGMIFSYDPDDADESKPEETLKNISYGSMQETSVGNVFRSLQNMTNFPETISPTKLSHFVSSMFATVLEDNITQLRILVECNSALCIMKTMSDLSLLLAMKYGVEQPKVTDELDTINPNNLGSEEYKLNKLDADRKYLYVVTVSTYLDLAVNKRFDALLGHVATINEREEYRLSLQDIEAKNKAQRRELNKQLRQLRNHVKSVAYDNDVIIENLKTQVEDSSLNAEIQCRYIDNWQCARTEQHLQTVHDTERPAVRAIDYYKHRADHEERVHSEIELLTNIAINETLDRVEKFMNKYDIDMEKIDLKIQIQKNDYQNMLDKRLDLEKTIEKHDILMKDWIYFKEEREKARLYREKMTKSAITVQAWWRGLLVRRMLGPYKVAKKKRGKKK